MRKKLLPVFLLLSLTSFSQNVNQKIQDYINENRKALHVSQNETTQWEIVNETSSESMGLKNYFVNQTFNGIRVENSFIYFWIKNDQVINQPEGFIENLNSKITTSTPSFDVLTGFGKALNKVNENVFTSSIISTDRNKYKLTNGALLEDPVTAELVYFVTENNEVKLVWSYEFYTQSTKNLWKIKIDAITGELLEKYDLVHTCSFGPKHNHDFCSSNKENKKAISLFKTEEEMMLTPGTTNYRVIPWNYESPNHSQRQLITNPEATTVLAPATTAASPNGWHNTNNTIGGGTTATQFNYTRGNNVFAKDDLDSNNTGGTYPTGGTSKFNF